MKIQKYLEGEPVTRETIVNGDMVTINHVTTLKDGSKAVTTTMIDLGPNAITPEEIKSNAAMNLLIKVFRPRFYRLHSFEEIKNMEDKTFRLADFPAERAKAKPTKTKARDILARLSKDEFVNLIMEEYDITEEAAVILYAKKHEKD